jgi:hypothetical protein
MSESENYQGPVESERRRPDGEFRADVRIVLCDGQGWHFPKPRLIGKYMTPIGPDGNLESVGVTEYGPEYDFRAEELIVSSIRRSITGDQFYWFATYLLKRNYILTDKDFYWLLRIDASPENLTMWMDIMATATGLVFMVPTDPKASTPVETRSFDGRNMPSSATTSTPTA